MIAKLKGVVDSITDDSIIVDVNGVGYAVFVSDRARDSVSVGIPISLVILHVFKQDTQYLCGFLNNSEKKVFEVLLAVHGVGIRLAMAILSHLTTEEFATAVATQDPALLYKAGGVGRKTAERILLELKDKNIGQIEGIANLNNANVSDVMLGLLSLGYSKSKVSKVVTEVVQQVGSSASTDIIIIECIKKMG
ncbi:MAG: Holliday junction branch migration protein RuvA [Holosporales bacterium]|nr:Holliday junction branch migration protein RuvA [Holosporales bacterium]